MSKLSLITLAAVLVCSGLALAQDPVEVSPEVYKLLFENETVRVLEMTLAPGEMDAVHQHPTETVYFLGGGQATILLPDGEQMEADIPDGHVMYHEAWTHQVKNRGETEIHAIIVELKPEPMGATM